MGIQGLYSKEGEMLSRRDLALLPEGTVIRCHVHARNADQLLERLVSTAERHHGAGAVLPKRTAHFGSRIIVEPGDHDQVSMATDYMVTLSSPPLKVSASFGVARPDFHGGRKKQIPRKIEWLKAPTEKPRTTSNQSRRRLKRADWFK